MKLDVAAARRSHGWTTKQRVLRALWECVQKPIFNWTPRAFFWGWRRTVLRLFGARIGSDVRIHPSVKIAIPWTLDIADGVSVGDFAILYGLGRISIGTGATISQFAHLCAGTHDFRDPAMPLLKPPILIGSGAWICADAFIGPGVEIGDMAIVAARATVVKNVGSSEIVAGNPARVVGRR